MLEGMANETQQHLDNDMQEPTADEWVKTSYIYDVTMPYGQLLTESTGSETASYT
jgi:hypothetical protein